MKEFERMIVDNSKRIDALDSDLNSLKGEVGILKVDMTKISTTLDFQEERSKERFEALNTSQIKIAELIYEKDKRDEQRANEAMQYRHRREEMEAAASLEHKKWARSLITPQTVVLMLFILAALFGIRVADMSAISDMLGLSVPSEIESLKATKSPNE